MKVLTPTIASLPVTGLLLGRNPKTVFLKKHNLQVNLAVVEAETKQVTRPTAKDWLFLVEGFKAYSATENQFLDNFVDEFGIKTEDPIVKPFTFEIADAASMERTTAALSVLTMDYLDLITENPIGGQGDDALEKLFNQSVCAVAKAFGVTSRSVRQEFSRLGWRNETVLNQQLLALSKKRDQLISESNSQSRVKLTEILDRNKEPNLFIMSGIEHATIFS